jgi:lipid A 4'-phosphatase
LDKNLRALSLTLILVGLAVAAAVFALYPEFDLQIASLFYDTSTHAFTLARNPIIVGLRNLNTAIDIVIGIVLAASILLARIYPKRPALVSPRATIFVVATFIFVPLLIANGVFKEHWSRPRPSHVTQFGGPAQFRAWWDPRGTCQRNCSFFSGEVSTAAWTVAPALLVPGVGGPIAIAAAIIFTGAIAVVRIAQGAHFFSDTAFAAFLTWLSVWVAYNLCCYRQGRSEHRKT